MRTATVSICIGIAAIAGIACGELATRSIVLRENLGALCGRGHLLGLVDGAAIYESDLDRAVAESNYLAGIDHYQAATAERQSTLKSLIANLAAVAEAAGERIRWQVWKRERQLVRRQFGDDKTWRAALQGSRLSARALGEILRGNLRTRLWISKRIAPEIEPSESECRAFYDSHLADFFVPERIRASHLFLAAPPETPPDVVEAKRVAIEALALRLAAGEDFAALVAQNSEDEATKLRGGDLDYFTANRMPPDFVATLMKLHPDEISAPVRTRLGFHIIKRLDTHPPRQRNFEEVRGDIAIQLGNQKRAAVVQKLVVDLSSKVEHLRPL